MTQQPDHICFQQIQFAAVTRNGFSDVSILTAGEADGHGVMVDEETINDFMKLSMGKTIPAYLTHAGAVDANGRPVDRLGKEIGMFSGFYRDGMKVRAKNFKFLQSFIDSEPKAYATLIEMAQNFSDKLGISPVLQQIRNWVMGDGSEMPADGERPEGATGMLPIMRILGIKSLDFVQQPAANIGLFEAKVDAPPIIMNPESVLLSVHTAALSAKDGEITVLSTAHKDSIVALEAKHADEIVALGAKLSDAIAKLSVATESEKSLNALLAAKTQEAEMAAKYDMRKAGAPALEIALQSHTNAGVPSPAVGDHAKWAQFIELSKTDAAAAAIFKTKYLSRK